MKSDISQVQCEPHPYYLYRKHRSPRLDFRFGRCKGNASQGLQCANSMLQAQGMLWLVQTPGWKWPESCLGGLGTYFLAQCEAVHTCLGRDRGWCGGRKQREPIHGSGIAEWSGYAPPLSEVAGRLGGLFQRDDYCHPGKLLEFQSAGKVS